MKLELTYERQIDAWVLTHDEVRIASAADVALWRDQLLLLIARWKGRREYLLVDVRGFSVDPAFGADYGRVATDVIQNHAKGVVRFGTTDGLTSAQVRLQALRNRYPSCFVVDREAAIELLSRLRALPET